MISKSKSFSRRAGALFLVGTVLGGSAAPLLAQAAPPPQPAPAQPAAAQPAPLAPGQSINLQFLLGVQKTGSFKFFFNIEALP